MKTFVAITAGALAALAFTGSVCAQEPVVRTKIRPAPSATPAPAAPVDLKGEPKPAAAAPAPKPVMKEPPPAKAPAKPAPVKLSPRQPKLPPLGPDEPRTSYTVKKGDTLWGLADKYFLRRPTYEEVRERNGVKVPKHMPVGLQIEIPTRLLRTALIPARLGAYKGEIAITGGGVTGAPAVGMYVYEGALVATTGNAFARLDLPDGSRISVPSQSRVRLSVLQRVLLTGAIQRTFTVESGRSESAVAPVTGPQDNYFVRTPVSVSAVRGTDFRVGYEPGDNAATTGVVTGAVAVDAPSVGSALIPAEFGIGIKPGKALAVVPLLPAPAISNPGKVQEVANVSFDIQPVAGAKAYRIVLANDAGIQDVFAEQTTVGLRQDFTGVKDGEFFLRVTAVDPADIEGLPKVYAFERSLNSIVGVGSEPVGTGGDRRFRFKWLAEGEGQRTYRIQVYRQPSDQGPLIDEGGLKEPEIALSNLKPGTYSWRVMSMTLKKGRYIELWSAPLTFTVGN